MPELPEVETIKRGLEKYIVGKKILKLHILCEKSFFGKPELVEGQKITEIRRRFRLKSIFWIPLTLRFGIHTVSFGKWRIPLLVCLKSAR